LTMTISAEWDVRGYRVRIDAEWDARAGRHYCAGLSAQSLEAGQRVDQNALRSIPIADLLRRTVQAHMAGRAEEPLAFDSKRLGPETLPAVARIYRDALQSGDREPTKAVARAMGVPRGRAGQWVHLARRGGLLGPTAKGKVSA
jgi:hypothetical protein